MGKKAFDPGKTRTFALAGHRSTGKTSLAEILLTTTGATRKVGRVDDRSSLLDHGPFERRRGMTLGSGFAWLQWREHLLELVDTPGSEGVAHERALALQGVDAVVIVVSAADGVEYGTEHAFAQARRLGLPVVFVVTAMDRAEPEASDRIVADLGELCEVPVLPLQIPFRDDEGRFAGLVSLLDAGGPRALRYDEERQGRYSPEPLPERYRQAAHAAREHVVERVALTDDALLEEYLEFLELPPDKVVAALGAAVRRREATAVLFASSEAVIGAEPVLDAVVDLLPSPLDRVPPLARDTDGAPVRLEPAGPFTAQLLATRLDPDGNPYHVLRVWSGELSRGAVWTEGETGEQVRIRKVYQVRGPRRTTAANTGPGTLLATWEPLPGRPGSLFSVGRRLAVPRPEVGPPMMSYLLTPLTRRDEEALPAALAVLQRLDAALEVSSDGLTGGPVLSGQGQMHLEVALEILRDRLGVQIDASLPPVPYAETPASPVRRVQGLHKRSNGHGEEYGECWIDLDPQAPQEGVRFENRASDFSLPTRFVPSIDEGIREASRHGPTAGYPVVGVGVRCVAGEYNALYSEEPHFREAGARALRAALQKSGTELLEPWSSIRVEAAASEIGQVIAEINGRRGRIVDLEVGPRTAQIEALLPYREVRTFAPRLQAVTGGRGRFRARHSHYEKLPGELVREAIDASPWRETPTDMRLDEGRGGCAPAR